MMILLFGTKAASVIIGVALPLARLVAAAAVMPPSQPLPSLSLLLQYVPPRKCPGRCEDTAAGKRRA